jgi:hypothetical protein
MIPDKKFGASHPKVGGKQRDNLSIPAHLRWSNIEDTPDYMNTSTHGISSPDPSSLMNKNTKAMA